MNIQSPRVLRLHLKGVYFDEIKAGTKTHEYRLASKWAERVRKACYRIGLDEILLLRGYPKRGDESRMLRRKWNGYDVDLVNHPEFGWKAVLCLVIDVSKPVEGAKP